MKAGLSRADASARGRLVACALVCMVGSACAPSAPAPESEVSLPGAEIPLDGLTRSAANLRRRMAARGYGEAQAQTRAFALEGSGFAFPVDLPKGRCATFVAIGGGDLRQVELTVFDGNGTPVVADTTPGEGGLAHICPPGTAGAPRLPYHLAVIARSGSGAVQVSMFLSGPGEGRGFQDLFHGVLAPVVPSTALSAELDAFRDSLRERGFLPAGPNTMGTLGSAGALRARIALEPAHCYVAIATTGEGVADADFFLFDPSGAEVARDLSRGTSLRLEHCPSVAGRHTFELRAYRGTGAAGFVTLEGPRQDDGRATQTEDAETEPPDQPRGARAALSRWIASLLNEGFTAPEWVVADGTMGPGEVRTEEMVLGPGCAVLVAAAAEQDADLDLYLVDADGRALDRDTRVRATAQVVACPTQATLHRVQIKLYGHAVSFALARLRAPAGVTHLREARLLEAEREIAGAATVRRPPTVHPLDDGSPVTLDETVEAGRCVGFAAGGDAELEDIDLFLRSETGELLASDTGPAPWASLRYCAREQMRLSLELVAYRGAGQCVVERLDPAP